MNSSSIRPHFSTTKFELCVIDFISQHDEGVDQQMACDRDLSSCLLAAMQHSVIEFLHFCIFPRRLDPGFDEQEA